MPIRNLSILFIFGAMTLFGCGENDAHRREADDRAGTAALGCRSDSECKGLRTCRGGRCVRARTLVSVEPPMAVFGVEHRNSMTTQGTCPLTRMEASRTAERAPSRN